MTETKQVKLSVEKQTLTYVDSYGVIHISNVEDLNVHDMMKVFINIMRVATYSDESIVKALEKATIDF